jgi:hypothetical protein
MKKLAPRKKGVRKLYSDFISSKNYKENRGKENFLILNKNRKTIGFFNMSWDEEVLKKDGQHYIDVEIISEDNWKK